ncbi:MAG: hypothetical protein AB8H79_09365 [Myxococcota bacterium]
MSDERLEAGRHHLLNGRRAVQLGYPDEGRSYYEAALLQFRGPELRLGEAHALRGIAQVELSVGDVAAAETRTRAALDCYQSLLEALEKLDDPSAVEETRDGALEGEAAAWALLGDVLSRRGRSEAARAALQSARNRFGDLGEGLPAAGVWSALGRVALREDRAAEARDAFEQSAEHHRKANDTEGEVVARMMIAESYIHEGDIDHAELELQDTRILARNIENKILEGRVLCSLGACSLRDGRAQEAFSFFEDALPLSREAGDTEREGVALVGMGSAASARNDAAALGHLLDGAKALASLDHKPGLANTMLRIGNHARSVDAPVLALAAAEVARRMHARTDPIIGQGQALRTAVKALTALRQGRASLAAAIAREKLAGNVQPNANSVADWMRARAPDGLADAYERLTVEELLAETRSEAERVLGPTFEQERMSPDVLDDAEGALALFDALGKRAGGAVPKLQIAVDPDASPPTEGDEDVFDDFDEIRRTQAKQQEAEKEGEYVSIDDVYDSLYDADSQ